MPYKTSNKTPIKMLIAQEMSTEIDSRCDPPNLVAKLMGVDALLREESAPTTQRSHTRIHPRNISADFSSNYSEPQNQYFHYIDPNKYKDVHRKWQLPQNYEDSIRMNLVRQKFTEAKRLSMGKKLRQSKQFQDTLDVLSSHRDLFLKCLQEPNPTFTQHLHVPPETRRITVLRPSKVTNCNDFAGARYRDEKQIKKGTFLLPNNMEKAYPGNSTQPTRIVVLKPGPRKLHDGSAVGAPQSCLPNILFSEEFFGDAEDDECRVSRKVAKLITQHMRKRFEDHREGETLVSSIFSTNGYAGNESLFNKLEMECEDSNPINLEATSPGSGKSWDCANKPGSPYSSPMVTRASYSPESLVCREAKKRLSERWAMMASNGSCSEQRHFQRSSSTLGEMLALLETKKEGSHREDESCFELFVGERKREENADCSPRNLTRSKSVPALSMEIGTRQFSDTAESDKRYLESPRDYVKETSVLSSFRGKVSSLFFSKNKKTGKSKSPVSGTKEVTYSFPGEICCDKTVSLSERVSGCVSPEPTPTGQQGIIYPETELARKEPIAFGNIGEKHEQPNPFTLLDPPLEENKHTTMPPDQQGIENLLTFIGPSVIDKSPPIGSIARTISCDDSCVNMTSSSHPKPEPFPPSRKTEDERHCFSLVKTLLSSAGIRGGVQSTSFLARWHSPESPLDPSLRKSYIDDSNNTFYEAKRQHYLNIHELVFDCVNEVLMDIAGINESDSCQKLTKTDTFVVEAVWARMKMWFQDKEDGRGAHYSLAVDRVVGREVEGKGWNRTFRLKVDDLGNEIGGELLEELMEEAVIELTGTESNSTFFLFSSS